MGNKRPSYAEFVAMFTVADYHGDSTIDPELGRDSIERKVMRAVSGMVNEAGEANQLIHKAVYRGHNLDLNLLTLEVSDEMFYIQQFCNAVGITIAELIDRNRTKLIDRYPQGYDPNIDQGRY